MDNSVRKPYVAGKFYPATAPEISELFETIIQHEKPAINYDLAEKHIEGAVLPHAGHLFSGYQTVHFFEILAAGRQDIETFVIIHPIHRGGDIDYAADDHYRWRTPLGEIPVDQAFIEAMNIEKSGEMHKWEHSAEVMLPFIQKYEETNVRIVPVGMGWQHPEASRRVADAIIDAEKKTGRKICVIASSDFSHYLDPETGRRKDQLVLDHILRMEPDEIYGTVRKNNISVCGYGPIMSLMYYALARSPGVKAEVLSRGNSGDVYPSDSVVDYISILFYTDS
ncbi:MAG TPA: AmmeMemoRadiSam system protein B [Bacteroidales bacterium]|nr:AmmeMemoRadiSam system protein B [Bacteroidales bacterium]